MPDSQPQPSHGATANATALLLRGARLTDGRVVDVRLSGGRIEAVGTAGESHRGRLRAWTWTGICSCPPPPSRTRTVTPR